EGAIRSCREAIRLDPKDAKAHFNLGNALRARGDLEGALRSYREAIRVDPKDALPYGALGQTLLRQGHLRQARRPLRRCQQLLPPGDSHQRRTAQLLQQCQQGLDLLPRLEAVLQGQPAPADAHAKARLGALAQLPAQQRFATAASLYAAAL